MHDGWNTSPKKMRVSITGKFVTFKTSVKLPPNGLKENISDIEAYLGV